MQTILGRVLSVLLGLGLAFPARAVETSDKFAAIHSVGIISSFGHTAQLKNVGAFIFSNTEDTLNIDDMGIDAAVIDKVAAALSPHFTVKPVIYDEKDFTKRNPDALPSQRVQIQQAVSKLDSANDVDAYVVIYPVAVQDPIWQTTQYFYGMGVYRRGLITQSSIAVFAYYAISVIDAHSNKIIASDFAKMGPFDLFKNNNAFAFVDAGQWSATTNAFTDEQKQKFHTTELSIFDQSLSWTLSSMGLTPNVKIP